ncbi:site-specific DNA-methyltransferase [Candidatus Symbiobacter mobilis]|uniref:site-specific DNA-methyltransferase (adenine-specific) n=1 Tax=Candidatus Symbiobacter mobilis CR TaxID=946483 RepID=U5NDQ7_9BURK|nr:site-specific DNA-methyltransferase [Candidatus Symbiobacter mobilis]AGX88299.1 adenine-specific DNA-methyltransferase [Candidatus Symbiobacter mobilis CR]
MQKIEPNSPEAQSADLVANNIAKLRAMFPELLTETGNGAAINVDVLKSLVGDATAFDGDEKYGLNWHGKRKARQIALTPSTGTLRPCLEESVDWDTTQNLMIEGDNLEVLKLLQKSYGRDGGQVRVIYIDPPYNTGKDFVYSDDFKNNIENYQQLMGWRDKDGERISSLASLKNTEASGRFHTDWLNMIYPRLKLARTLLTADGVILVSIDEHEITNLRSVMDEVFGEENFLSCLTWEKGRKNDAKFFSNGHEYILVYAKSQIFLREKGTMWREEKPGAREIWDYYLELRATHGKDDKKIENELQVWFSALPKKHPSKKWSRYKRVDSYGPWRDDNISWPGGGGPTYDVLHPITAQPCKVPERGWVFSTWEEMKRRIDAGIIEFRADHTQPPLRKSHIRPIPLEVEFNEQEDDLDEEIPNDEDEEELATQVRGSYFYKQSQVSVKYLRTLFGKKVFNNPKDLDEIAKLVRYTTSDDPNAVVLDFFAGSGTTGEAVMRLNSQDDGNRRYILVQLPEPLDPKDKQQKVAAKYCEDIGKPLNIAELTKERLRKAGNAIKAEKPDWNGDAGVRVFKLDTSNIRPWNPKTNDLKSSLFEHLEHLEPSRTSDDVLYEILLKLGLDLCVPIEKREIAGKQVNSVGAGVLLACLDETIKASEVEALALGMVAWREEQGTVGDTTAVFRDSAFENDVAKSNLAAILEQHGIKQVRSL